jgi:hypothetical protein
MSNERFVGPLPAPPPRNHSGKATGDDTLKQAAFTEEKSDHTPTQHHLASHPYQNLLTISRFMSDFKARKTLAGNRLSESFRIHNTEMQINESSVEETDRYLSAVDAFAKTQMDRQNAGLGSSARVESAGGLVQLVQSHGSAINAAIMQAEMEMEKREFKIPARSDLCFWHSVLCPNHEQSGKFRTTPAKAGKTAFCHPADLDSELESFAAAMEQLYSKWASQILAGPSSPSASAGPQREESLITSTYYSVALAAVMLYGTTDIHPFADGNGRLGRICTNWTLRRILGLPFTITIAVNPTQRAEYMAGLKTSLRWILSLRDVDPSNPDFPLSVTHGTKQSTYHIENGIFQDLIHLLLDRIAHACNECQRVVTERADVATANEEARIARQVREKAAAGQCGKFIWCISFVKITTSSTHATCALSVICLEENPNILTVCCGQATHLNCLAEWLGTASNCVACRKPLPTLQVRQHSQQVEAPPAEIETQGFSQPINAHANPRNDVWNRVLTNMLWEAAESADDMFCDNDECQNRAASDCPNFMCRVCCQSYGRDDCERHSPHLQETDESISTHTAASPLADDDDEPVSPRSQALPRCRRCSNLAATDCENQMCGRHCVLRGRHSCSRHNTIR